MERCASILSSSAEHCMISSPKEEYRGPFFFIFVGGRAKVHSEDCSSLALDLIRPLLIVLEKALTI